MLFSMHIHTFGNTGTERARGVLNYVISLCRSRGMLQHAGDRGEESYGRIIKLFNDRLVCQPTLFLFYRYSLEGEQLSTCVTLSVQNQFSNISHVVVLMMIVLPLRMQAVAMWKA